jgi:iron complex outermembrane receptor protein
MGNIHHPIRTTGAKMAASAVALGLLTPVEALPAATTALEEILVTARKREERLQETPVSVTAFTADNLRARSMDGLDQIARFVPNLDIGAGAGNSASPSTPTIYIRGIGQFDFIITTDPGVGIYVDGVYVARSTGAIMDMLDIERIEVLRGPQGTLFGKNTIGGALNIVSTTPSDVTTGKFELIGGERERFEARGYISGPISDKVAAKAALSYKHKGGYGDRLSYPDGAKTGEQGGIENVGGRLGVRAQLSDTFTADLGFDFSINRDEAVVNKFFYTDVNTAPMAGIWNMLVGIPNDTPLTNDFATPGRYDNYSTGTNRSDQDIFGGHVTLTWDPGVVTVKSITAYRSLDSFVGRDGDGTPMNLNGADYDLDQEQFSQELQLSGKSFNDRLTWLIGGFYLHEKADEVNNGTVMGGLFDALEALPDAVIPLAPGVTCPAAPPAPCLGGPGNPMNIGFDFDLLFVNKIKIDSLAVFAQGSYFLTDDLSVTLGIRHTYEKKDYVSVLSRRVASGANIAPPNTALSDSWSSTSPKAGIEYRITPDAMIYLSAAHGFKSGGYNGRAFNAAAFTSFDPEKIWSYEAGFKSEWFDRRLRLNAAAFYNDYTNIQLTIAQVNQDGSIQVLVDNAAAGKSKGFEVEMQAVPFENFEIAAGLGYLDTKYTKLEPGAPVTLTSKFPRAPEWTLNLAAQYTLPLANYGSLTFRSDYSYRSKFYVDANNNEIIAEDGYGLVDARITYAPENGNWQFAVFGQNLTNEDYITAGLDGRGTLGFYDVQKAGRPREFGASLMFQF